LLSFLCFYILAFIFVRRAKNTRLLYGVWSFFVLYNIANIIYETYWFITWTAPVIETQKTYLDLVDDFSQARHQRELYAYKMISPVWWIVTGCISIFKIRKEANTKSTRFNAQEDQLLNSNG